MKNSKKLKQKLPKELISDLIQFIPFNIKWSKIRISKLFDIFVIKYQRKWILYLILVSCGFVCVLFLKMFL